MPPEKDAASASAVPERRDDLRLNSGADANPETRAAALFAEAVAIMARLRAPGGCPWDREQTLASIRKYTLEETYEVLDAIEREHWVDLADELGDLLLQVLFYAEMAEEAGHFGIADVIAGLNRKLVRRHPHVFGEEASAAAGNRVQGLETDGIGAQEVLRNWEEIKKLEKKDQERAQGYPTQAKNGLERGILAGRLDSVSRAMPALSEAGKVGSKAAKAGFDWPDIQGVVEKLREECGELEAELTQGNQEAAREELGDLLFTVANLARHLKTDPEVALRDATAKFRRRFAQMEAATNRPLEELSAAELEDLWVRSKESEAGARR
jgi:nucleoside triphosphate diphosphatase